MKMDLTPHVHSVSCKIDGATTHRGFMCMVAERDGDKQKAYVEATQNTAHSFAMSATFCFSVQFNCIILTLASDGGVGMSYCSF